MRYHVPARVAHVVTHQNEESLEAGAPSPVFVRHVPGGPTLALTGSAAWIWRLAAEGVPDVPAAIAELTHEQASAIKPIVEGYIMELVHRGLLESAQ